MRRREDNGVYVIKTVRIVELTLAEQKGAINEVKILSVLDSHFVVKYYDSFIDTDSLHIVMEYCNKGDLQSLIKKAKSNNVRSLRESVVWNIGLQVILGLHYLHNQKILHRDLKSANVFLKKSSSESKSYDVKIGDLGVAKLLETSTAFAQTIVGTPYYLSPELCSDQPYRDKSDCWALGVLLYECCTLKHPFEARNQCALILKIIQEEHTQLPAGLVSPELEALISWLLEKEPSKRPTIREILSESFVQEKLQENRLSLDQHSATSKFDVPSDIADLPLTYRLTSFLSRKTEVELPSNVRFDGAINHAEDMHSESIATGNVGMWKNDQHVFPKPLPGVVRPPMRPSGPAPGTKDHSAATTGPTARPIVRAPPPIVSSSGGGGMVSCNSNSSLDKLRGDRVRAPSGSRVLSSKARERYQVRPSPASSAKVLTTDFDQTVVRAIEVKGSFEKCAPLVPDPSLDYSNITKIAESKHDDSHLLCAAKLEAHKRGDSDEDNKYEDEYEEDFHSDDEEDDDVAYYGDNRECEDEAEYDADGCTAASDHQATTRLLQTLSKKATVTSLDSGDSGDSGETVVDQDALISAFEQLILETRLRSIASLGEALFFRIYDLCSENMTEPEDAVIGSSAAKNAKLLKDLEKALCEQLQGGVEVACDAVFGVKILLALEDKLQQAINNY